METSISNQQLVDAYIKYRGFVRLDGEDGDLSCLIPLLLLDMHLQIFNSSIVELECHHLTQKARTNWRTCYNRFNHGSLLAFKRDYKDKIIELMDELSDYISNHVMFLRVAVMDVFKGSMDTETQQIVADIVMCNTFAQLASSWWGSIFKLASSIRRFSYIPEKNREIEGMIRYSDEFLNRYVNECLGYNGHTDLRKYPSIKNAATALDRKISEWSSKKVKE